MRRLMRWSAFLGGGILAVMFGLVIWLGVNKSVVIADTGSVSDTAGLAFSEELPGHELSLRESGEEGMFLRIPMENSISPENITMENRYAERRLVISVRGASGFFYENNRITGFVEPVEAASYTVESEGVTLYLQLSELYEYESILDKGYLQVNLYRPSERYDKVVILETKEIERLNAREREALESLEKKCRALLEADDFRVYSASGGSGEAALKNTLMLAEETGAGLYLGLTFDRDEDTARFGSYVCYNSLYFRPWLTNGDLADRMEQSLVTAIEGKALGLAEMEDGILRELEIPAVIICPGYVSHETEGALLLTDAYQERIAEGICSGVAEIFEEL